MPCDSITEASTTLDTMHPGLLTLALAQLGATRVGITAQGEGQFTLHGRTCSIEGGRLTVYGVSNAEGIAEEIRSAYTTQVIYAMAEAGGYNVVQTAPDQFVLES